MGTRSLTFTYDDGEGTIMCMYRQFDGYPEGHGRELAEIITTTENNGMECLSASIIAKLKKGLGGIYLYPSDSDDCWQEYEYHVYKDRVEVFNKPFNYESPLFKGSYDEFKSFCCLEEVANA